MVSRSQSVATTGDPHHHRDDGERGLILVLVAVAAVTIFTIVALVIDVGAAVSQRRRNQTGADEVALAIARLLPTNPSAACADGWTYVQSNVPDLPSGATSPCLAHGTSSSAPSPGASGRTPDRDKSQGHGGFAPLLVFPP